MMTESIPQGIPTGNEFGMTQEEMLLNQAIMSSMDTAKQQGEGFNF